MTYEPNFNSRCYNNARMLRKAPFSAAEAFILFFSARFASRAHFATLHRGTSFLPSSARRTLSERHHLGVNSAIMSLRLESPSANRNKVPIWIVLESKVVPTLWRSDSTARILEIAAGSGVHTQHFAKELLLAQKGNFIWYPTDADESSMASTKAYVQEEAALANMDLVMAPVKLTLNENGIMEPDTAHLLTDLAFDLILNINMIHISPWEATLGLTKLVGKKLRLGGFFFLYGPFKVGGTCTESNRYVALDGGLLHYFATCFVSVTHPYR